MSLRTPSGYRHIDDIATALEAIVYKAQDIQDCVNSQAENVGCNYIDEDERKRWKARDESRSAA
ncbi:MAG: hypothetical protein LZF64_09260 [Nitrosomonas sp.]|nr:MAG: hypothetical protein LZF64_09260 [Nitrosomonas sp.]